jgi:hypothetical protein
MGFPPARKVFRNCATQPPDEFIKIVQEAIDAAFTIYANP